MESKDSQTAGNKLFWSDKSSWIKAAKNTLNCLIGCSIGDFGTIILFQIFWPQLNIFLVMGIAMINGLISSVLFESILLRIKEAYSWQKSIKMAFTMSFLSMLAMELTAIFTDYLLTGGKVPPSVLFYWFALMISFLMGFLVPLPYNYYKLWGPRYFRTRYFREEDPKKKAEWDPHYKFRAY